MIRGMLWHTVRAIGPPNSTLFRARTLMKYALSVKNKTEFFFKKSEHLLQQQYSFSDASLSYLKGQYHFDQSRLSTRHGIGVLA